MLGLVQRVGLRSSREILPTFFEAPTGPDTYVRRMRLVHVPEDHEFGQNGLWEKVRDWVCDFLITQ
jgi:hypothetical protein